MQVLRPFRKDGVDRWVIPWMWIPRQWVMFQKENPIEATMAKLEETVETRVQACVLRASPLYQM